MRSQVHQRLPPDRSIVLPPTSQPRSPSLTIPASPPDYTQSLHQVNSLLALDPGNEQYKSLASDLAAATRLTEQLIKAQTGGGAGAEEAAEASTVPTGRCVGVSIDSSFGKACMCVWPHLFTLTQIKIKSDDRPTTRAAATPQGAGRSGVAEQCAVDGPRRGPGGGPVWGQTLPWYAAFFCISTMPLLAASVIQMYSITHTLSRDPRPGRRQGRGRHQVLRLP